MVHIKIAEIWVAALVCMHDIYSFALVEGRDCFCFFILAKYLAHRRHLCVQYLLSALFVPRHGSVLDARDIREKVLIELTFYWAEIDNKWKEGCEAKKWIMDTEKLVGLVDRNSQWGQSIFEMGTRINTLGGREGYEVTF